MLVKSNDAPRLVDSAGRTFWIVNGIRVWRESPPLEIARDLKSDQIEACNHRRRLADRCRDGDRRAV